jgi:hypothetical protein
VTAYRHSQIGHALIFPLIVMALLAGILVASASSEGLGWLIAILLVITAGVFYKLTIIVDDTHVRAVFGPGFTFRKIKLADITDCEPIRIRWWYGWGIHLTPYGWLYNVSGWDAVAITLRSGRRVSLGTDQPNELCAAIRRSASEK